VVKVEIYSSLLCPFCYRAKALLKYKGVKIFEIDVDKSPLARREMIKRADGRTSVPQIFFDDIGIGGSDDLADLEASGELDRLLLSVEC
tara:strand:+ start:154 stop:420 length:267 start_codon:yes stop_codon:yes gene_type:complete